MVALTVGFAVALRRALDRIDALEAAFDDSSSNLERIQAAFHRFTPQAVVEDIIRSGVSTHSERREVTVLFADLVGFTAMSETLDPEVLAPLLNGYFRAMSDAISENRGHVSKFIGDGILATFGVPGRNPWQALDAVAAAVAMEAKLEEYNQLLRERSLPELRLSIGIHRGEVVAGIFGSSHLMEYTVLGDTVNTAARVESLTRTHGEAILVTQAVVDRLDERFVLAAMPPASVKGKSEPLVTYAVRGRRDAALAVPAPRGGPGGGPAGA
jgi:adenylate cyclase